MTGETLSEYCSNLANVLATSTITDQNGHALSLDEGADTVVAMMLAVKARANKVMVIGNGGSAAIASHTQNDLCKAVGVRSMLFDDTSLLTALSNDHGYECVYERPIEMWAEIDDLLIAISSSGNSENIIRAAGAAKRCGCKVITLSGFKKDNLLRRLGDVNFHVPIEDYGYVETAHAVMTHYFTDCAMKQIRTAARKSIPFKLVRKAEKATA